MVYSRILARKKKAPAARMLNTAVYKKSKPNNTGIGAPNNVSIRIPPAITGRYCRQVETTRIPNMTEIHQGPTITLAKKNGTRITRTMRPVVMEPKYFLPLRTTARCVQNQDPTLKRESGTEPAEGHPRAHARHCSRYPRPKTRSPAIVRCPRALPRYLEVTTLQMHLPPSRARLQPHGEYRQSHLSQTRAWKRAK